jgi:hypothetical protein
MIGRPMAAGVPFSWFAGDEVYADNGPLRTRLEQARVRYVLAVSCGHRVLPAPRYATTSGKQLTAHEDHDLRLEY